MMVDVAVHLHEMEIEAPVVRQCPEELGDHLGLHVSEIFAREPNREVEVGTAGKVDAPATNASSSGTIIEPKRASPCLSPKASWTARPSAMPTSSIRW